MSEVVAGLKRLSMLILGACTLPQAALPAIFANTPPTFLSGLMSQLQRQTLYLVERIRQITGLEPIVPQGAMYLMVRMDGRVLDFEDDQVFVQRLLDEAQVFVLPGSCFGAPMFFRIVTCPSIDVLSDACDRLEEFCARHHRGQGAATVELMDEKRQDVGDKKDSAEGTKLNPVNKMA